jgi:hypothetical protein
MTPVYFEPAGIETEGFGLEADTMKYEEALETTILNSWVTPDQNPTLAMDEPGVHAGNRNHDEAEEFRTSDEIANDLAFSFDHIEDLLRG